MEFPSSYAIPPSETPLPASNGESGTTTPDALPPDTAIRSGNAARIQNRISVVALTGENEASGNGGAAAIATGDASAAANVVNVVNTNIIGRNWLLAVVNILGNWNGNLSFGRPDLWVGARAETEGTLGPGGRVTYRFTVMNNGDADATGVTLENEFDSDHLAFADVSDAAVNEGTRTRWNLGAIAPGGAVEVACAATVSGDVDYGTTPITNTVAVVSNEPDENENDNTEVLSVTVYRAPPETPRSTGGGPTPSLSPHILMEKTASSTGPFTAPAVVEYRIVIKNDGFGPAYDTVLTDTLRDETGKVLKRQSWDLGEIAAGEEITVSYTMAFSTHTASGVYTNTAELSGYKKFPRPVGDDLMAPTAKHSVTMIAPEPPAGGEGSITEEQVSASGMGSGGEESGLAEASANPESENGGGVSESAPNAEAPATAEAAGAAEAAEPPEIESDVSSVPVAHAAPPPLTGDVRPTFLAAMAYAGYEAPLLGVLAILSGALLFLMRRRGRRSFPR